MNKPFAVAVVTATLTSAACDQPTSLVEPATVEASLSVLATPAAVPETPLHGRFMGTQTVTPLTPPLAAVEGSATGTATRLGRFTFAFPHTVNFATSSAQGTSTLVSADGDVITASFTGQAQVGPIVSIVEQAIIVGGTGRFTGVTGAFTVRRSFDPATGRTWGSLEGTISVGP
jgi:hypothetical protein